MSPPSKLRMNDVPSHTQTLRCRGGCSEQTQEGPSKPNDRGMQQLSHSSLCTPIASSHCWLQVSTTAGASIAVDETNISWKQDREHKYAAIPAANFNTDPALRGGRPPSPGTSTRTSTSSSGCGRPRCQTSASCGAASTRDLPRGHRAQPDHQQQASHAHIAHR